MTPPTTSFNQASSVSLSRSRLEENDRSLEDSQIPMCRADSEHPDRPDSSVHVGAQQFLVDPADNGSSRIIFQPDLEAGANQSQRSPDARERYLILRDGRYIFSSHLDRDQIARFLPFGTQIARMLELLRIRERANPQQWSPEQAAEFQRLREEVDEDVLAEVQSALEGGHNSQGFSVCRLPAESSNMSTAGTEGDTQRFNYFVSLYDQRFANLCEDEVRQGFARRDVNSTEDPGGNITPVEWINVQELMQIDDPSSARIGENRFCFADSTLGGNTLRPERGRIELSENLQRGSGPRNLMRLMSFLTGQSDIKEDTVFPSTASEAVQAYFTGARVEEIASSLQAYIGDYLDTQGRALRHETRAVEATERAERADERAERAEERAERAEERARRAERLQYFTAGSTLLLIGIIAAQAGAHKKIAALWRRMVGSVDVPSFVTDLREEFRAGRISEAVGRDVDYTRLKEEFERRNRRVITITAGGGAGKTYFAENGLAYQIYSGRFVDVGLTPENTKMFSFSITEFGGQEANKYIGQIASEWNRFERMVDAYASKGFNVVVVMDEIQQAVGLGATENNQSGGVENLMKRAITKWEKAHAANPQHQGIARRLRSMRQSLSSWRRLRRENPAEAERIEGELRRVQGSISARTTEGTRWTTGDSARGEAKSGEVFLIASTTDREYDNMTMSWNEEEQRRVPDETLTRRYQRFRLSPVTDDAIQTILNKEVERAERHWDQRGMSVMWEMDGERNLITERIAELYRNPEGGYHIDHCVQLLTRVEVLARRQARDANSGNAPSQVRITVQHVNEAYEIYQRMHATLRNGEVAENAGPPMERTEVTLSEGRPAEAEERLSPSATDPATEARAAIGQETIRGIGSDVAREFSNGSRRTFSSNVNTFVFEAVTEEARAGNLTLEQQRSMAETLYRSIAEQAPTGTRTIRLHSESGTHLGEAAIDAWAARAQQTTARISQVRRFLTDASTPEVVRNAFSGQDSRPGVQDVLVREMVAAWDAAETARGSSFTEIPRAVIYDQMLARGLITPEQRAALDGGGPPPPPPGGAPAPVRGEAPPPDDDPRSRERARADAPAPVRGGNGATTVRSAPVTMTEASLMEHFRGLDSRLGNSQYNPMMRQMARDALALYERLEVPADATSLEARALRTAVVEHVAEEHARRLVERSERPMVRAGERMGRGLERDREGRSNEFSEAIRRARESAIRHATHR